MVVVAERNGAALAEQMISSQDGANALLEEVESARSALAESGDQLQRKLLELNELQEKYEATYNKFSKSLKELNQGHLEIVEERGLKTAQSGFQKLMPITGGPFVELFLGKMNVRFPRKKESLQFKKDYELFKAKLSFAFVALCIISLLINLRWVHIFLQLFLSYYYVTIAIRENILRENGSNIKSWWIQHHYLMVCCGVVLVTWPSSDSYRQFAQPLHLFGLYTSFAQIFQTRYQMARLYTQRALGKAGEMDVINADTREIHWAVGLNFILPMVLMGHAFQLCLAIYSFGIFVNNSFDVHPFLVSAFNMAMFIGNFSTTMRIIKEKWAGRQAAKTKAT